MGRQRVRRALLCTALAWLAVAGFGDGTQAETLHGRALLTALRAGGFNLYFRHAATEWSQQDRIERAGDWRSCDPQRARQLSAAGRASARAAGAAMRRLQIPVAQVLASPYCRTVETAELLGLGAVQTTTDIMNLRAAEYFGGRDAIVARARTRLATAPAPGYNTVLVAHGNVAVAATDVYPAEGEAIVFRPRAHGGFTVVGRIEPDAWDALARPP